MADLQTGAQGQPAQRTRAPADVIPASSRSTDTAQAPSAPGANGSDWLSARVEAEGLQRYLDTIRERALLVLLCVVLTTSAAAAYLIVADKIYQAESDLLITPVSSANSAYVGLGLIYSTNDPTRDVLTASRLVETPSVARRVIAELGVRSRPLELLRSVEALPVTQSNIVSVRVKATAADEARRLADAFARQTVADRTDALHRQLDKLLPELDRQVATLPADRRSEPTSLAERVLSLQALRVGTDPTLQVLAPAELPDRPVSPRPTLTIASALFAGLVLGLSTAFGVQALDKRLRREEQLRGMFHVPLLCRIPREKGHHGRPMAPKQFSPSGTEAFRTLRSSLMTVSALEGPTARVVFVAGSTPSEGKTTTAVNLAVSLAETGASVILVEADLRHPRVGAALGTASLHGIEEVLLGTIALNDALVPASGHTGVRLLLASGSSAHLVNRLSLPIAERMISEARRMADYVIIDAPPLTSVIDALPLAHQADEIVVVARLKKTNLGKLADLGEVLARNSLRPVGTVLIGVESTPSYYDAQPDGSGHRRRRRAEVVQS